MIIGGLRSTESITYFRLRSRVLLCLLGVLWCGKLESQERQRITLGGDFSRLSPNIRSVAYIFHSMIDFLPASMILREFNCPCNGSTQSGHTVFEVMIWQGNRSSSIQCFLQQQH